MNQINLILQRSISQSNNRIEQTLQRLATGMRINSPADDPTGLVLSSNLNSEIRTLAQAMQNAQDGINLLHTGIDSLQTMESTLLKLKELTEKAANGTYSASERQEMQKQANELLKSLYTTKNSTSFGQINIFGSKLGSVTAPSTPSVASYVNYAAFMYDTPSSVGSATNDGSGYKNYEINTTAASYTAQNLSSSAPVTDSNAAASETIIIRSAQEFVDKISQDGTGTEGKTYVLDADIDLSSISDYAAKENFAGTLDGNGHTITFSDDVFSSTTKDAVIQNLYASSTDNSAAVVGTNNGTVEKIFLTKNLSETVDVDSLNNQSEIIRGIVETNNGIISESKTEVNGQFYYYSGDPNSYIYITSSLIAEKNNGVIRNTYSSGTMNFNGQVRDILGSISGLVANNTGTITNSFSSVEQNINFTLSSKPSNDGISSKNSGNITSTFAENTTTGTQVSDISDSSLFSSWDTGIWDISGVPSLKAENNMTSKIYITSAQEFIDKIARNGSNTEGQVYVLGNDIDFSTVSNYTAKTNFAGTIIGNGHTIKNLTSNQGLFESTTETASIRDLTLDNFTITASGNNTGSLVGNNRGDIDDVHIINSTINGGSYQNIGGLAGHSYNAAISNSSSSATVSGGNHVGGLVGSNDATITNSYSTGDVTGTEDVGGLVGSTSGDISNSYSTGNVSGTDNIGGLVGNHTTGSTISNSYATGDVTGTSSVGGLTGVTLPYAVISNSYATGTVTGTEYVGALAGLYDGVITNSFFNKETSGVSSALGSGSSYGVTGLTGSQFATSTPFVNAGWSEADWDFTVDGPHLVWENYEPAGSTIHISSAQEFIDKIAQDGTGTAGRTYILDNDIDFSTISNYVAKENFSGTIIGNGHTIKNLTSDQGLFVTTTNTASISDLTLENFTITASENNTGALVGVNRGDIDDVHVNNSTINGGSYSATGALVGSNYGAISNSSSSATVSGDSIVGGLVGFNYDASITNSYATGNVEGSESVGGLIGANYSAGIITNSYATGNVNGKTNTGGLIGQNNSGTIENSHATGRVESSGENTGGLVGLHNGTGIITNSYATGNVEGRDKSGGLVGQHSSGSITGSYATGDIFGQTNVGGFSGSNNGIIENSYATGDVEGSDNAGGFAGVNYGTITGSYAEGAVSGYSAIGGFVGVNSTTASGNGEISDSYSTGTVTGISGGSGNIGGFVGNMTYGTFTNVYSYGAVNSSATNTGGFAGTITGGSVVNSFWNTTAAGMTGVSSGASTGLTGLTTQEFMNMNNFVGAGWNDTIWNLTQGNPRPHLEWENYVGPGVTPGDEGDPDFDGYPDFPDSGGQSGSYPTDPGNSEAKTEVVLQIGTDNDESSRWTIDTSLDFDDIWINLSNSDTSNLSLDSIDAALSTVREKIASFSTTADILKSSIETSEAKSENLEAAKSTILDADIAAEMVELMKAKRQFELSNTMLIQAGNIQYDQAMALINGLNFSSSGQEVQNTLNNIQNNGRQHQSILDVIQDNKISHQDILNSIQNNNIYHQSILDVVADNNAKNNIMLKMINKYK